MIPELGKYAGAVLSAYGVSFVLLALIVGASVWRARNIRTQLKDIEDRLKAQRSQ